MPLDSTIPLRVKALDLGSAADSYFQAKNQSAVLGMQKQKMEREGKSADLQNKLTEEQISQAKFKSMDDREKSRMGSVIYGAAELKPYLDSGDIEGARNFLTRRRANLEKRIAAGENVDTAETDEALEHLDSNPEQLKQNIGHVITFGQQTGILKSKKEMIGDIPMGVKEYSAFKQLSPQERQVYLNLKRNTVGEGLTLDEDGNATGISGYNRGRESIKAAESKGNVIGKKQGELVEKEISAPQVSNLIGEAETLLPNATSGGFDNLITTATNFAGKSTPKSSADSQLDVIAAGLTSNVPRMEGPQSDADTKLYKQAAADVGNRNLPYESRLAAVKELKKINDKYLNKQENQSQQSRMLQTKSGHKFEIIR